MVSCNLTIVHTNNDIVIYSSRADSVEWRFL